MKNQILKRSASGIMISLLVSLFIISCEKYTFDPPTVDPNIPLSFQTDIIPIFTANCAGCHGGSIAPDLRAANAYSSISSGNYINLGEPDKSRIYSKLLETSHSAKASEIEKQKILVWIIQGAQNN
jgi:hypothetical protein